MGCSSPSTKDNDNENNEKIIPSDKMSEKVISKQKEINFDKNISTLKPPEIKKNGEKTISSQSKDKTIEKLSLSNQGIKKEEKNLISKQEIIQEEKINDENKSLSKQEELKDNESLLKQEDIKENEKITSMKIEIIDKENKIIKKDKILNEKSESSLSKEKKVENSIYSQYSGKITLFLNMDRDPLEKYNYFKIDFTKCNYIFITPEPLSILFSSFYNKILKDALIFFPKDFKQAEELLNGYESEVGSKENWIMISPCDELESNISNFNNNKNIYCFLGYCPIFEHEHNFYFFYKYSKFYGIVNSANELIEKLFKLNYIIYYRKKLNYEIINDNNTNYIFELKYDTKLLIDYENECSKNYFLKCKLKELYDFKILKENCYFSFIQSLTLLNKYIEEKDFNFYSNIIKDFSAFIIVSNDLTGKEKTAPTLLKNLHLLYLYFSNYPYLFGVLTDEEIDETLSQFKEEFNKDQTIVNLAAGYNVLVKIAYLFDFAVDNGLSILNEKERLKIFHKTLIEIICSNDQLKDKKSYKELSEYYQIKNYLRDIDFCLGKVIIDIIKNSCKNYPLELDIYNTYSDNEKRSFLYKLYRAIVKLYNENKQEDEYIKAYNKAIKYNDTIVLGEEQFFNSIKKIDLPCQNIYYLKNDDLLDFFLFPKKINNKYKIIKYFVIMNEKYGNKYLETIRYISDVFGIKFGVIIYIKNKYIKINKEIIQHPFLHIILAYSEKDILNYYYDSIIRIKDINLHFLEENEALEKKIIEIDYKFPKLNETKIIKEEDNG